MYRKYTFLLFLFVLLLITACTPNPDLELYEGSVLRIAVIGEPPEVNEDQVRFEEITFNEIITGEMSSYDAVFVTEDKLIEASESKYADIYLKSTTPFFFISTISHVPFTVKGTEYDNIWNWTAGNNYAVGVLTSSENDTLVSWGFGLYNEEKNHEHVKDVYSRIFKTIASIKAT
jgi:hypothetical protein